MAMEAVYTPAWEQPHPNSYHSSLAGLDGSRESLVIGEDSMQEAVEAEAEREAEPPGSPHSITLPIEGFKKGG